MNRIQFDTGPRKGWASPLAAVYIRYEMTGTGWQASLSYDFHCGDYIGAWIPVHGYWPSAETAIKHYMDQLIKLLTKMSDEKYNDSQQQREAAQELLNQVKQYIGMETEDGQTDLFALVPILNSHL